MSALRETAADIRYLLADARGLWPNYDTRKAGDELVRAIADWERFYRRERSRSEPDGIKEVVADLRSTIADFVRPTNMLDVKRTATSSGTEISGYASVFGVLDSDLEIVDSGAFAKSLAEHKA